MDGPTDDWTLLAAYANERSHEAFAKIVARYADMVFAAASRRTRSRDLAEDVTQAVFIALARKARTLKPRGSHGGSLGGWLHQTALYAANNAIRAESTRRRHERAAAEALKETTYPASDTGSEHLASQIDAAIHHLRHDDRQIVVMHYIEGKAIADAAGIIGINEEAARKRLTRALNRLRSALKVAGDLPDASSVASALESIVRPPARASTVGAMAALAIAGGENGRAFVLANELVRSMRRAALRKAAVLAALLGTLLMGVYLYATARSKPAVSNAIELPNPPLQTPTKMPATQPGVALPPDFLAILARNAEQLSPLTITWTEELSSSYTGAQLAQLLKIAPDLAASLVDSRRKSTLIWQDHMYFSQLEELARDAVGQNIVSNTIQISFDQHTVYAASKSAARGRWQVFRRPPSAYAEKPYYVYDANSRYIWETGYQLPLRVESLRNKAPSSTDLEQQLAHGYVLISTENRSTDGRRVFRVTLSGPEVNGSARTIITVFDFDPSRNYAMTRTEKRSADGYLISDTSCDDFIQLAGRDVYLPRMCISNSYGNSQNRDIYFRDPITTVRYTVTDMALNRVPADSFVIGHNIAGTRVTVQDDPALQGNWIVQSDGSWKPDLERLPATMRAARRAELATRPIVISPAATRSSAPR